LKLHDTDIFYLFIKKIASAIKHFEVNTVIKHEYVKSISKNMHNTLKQILMIKS